MSQLAKNQNIHKADAVSSLESYWLTLRNLQSATAFAEFSNKLVQVNTLCVVLLEV